MPAYGVIGAQWGDEGKGKIIDYLAEKADCVVRYGGGNNAGHTVVNSQGEFSLHLVPSGIFRPRSICIIGSGVVVDPDVLLKELEYLSTAEVDTSRLQVSDRAHLIMPYHGLLDNLDEKSRGDAAIGTTGMGVGPAYMDKTGRTGIRAGDLKDLPALRPRLEKVVESKNAIITRIYGGDPISASDIYEKCEEWAEKMGDHIQSAEVTVRESLARGENVLLEGAQGTLLDVDHGTYPYVTSSSPSVGGACTGLGISPREIVGIVGVFKAYCTRVGGGPMPSEMFDSTGDALREKAYEYGTTTGRARRIGWFDGVAGRYSANVNGFTSLVLTRLDVLDGLESIKVCTGYKVGGKVVKEFPASISTLENCQPVFEELPGWSEPTASTTSKSALPKAAVDYINCIEDMIGCPVHLISTGPGRDETIPVGDIL